ncbi:MAG TPA: Imm8 family immunity protein [Gemmatimonadales bacterium]|nr:Imm8 family immunity protein [Gemmatimonadales bacterium]
MIYPELRQIRSLDLVPPALPPDPQACAVRFEVVIGPRGGPEREAYAFTVVTPGALARLEGGKWGRSCLLLPTFDWDMVQHALAQLLATCARASWDDVAAALSQELHWQFGTTAPAEP